MNWFLFALQKYAVFSGRSQRSEFWYFILFYFIFSIILTIIDVTLGLYDEETALGLLSSIFDLAVLIPSIAVTVRRLHDIGRTGWWYLIILVPLVGLIVMIVFCAKDSQPGPNKYGPNPKDGTYNPDSGSDASMTG